MSLSDLDVQFNSNGWGPVNGTEVPAFIGVSYAHYDKKERINRAADFAMPGYFQSRQPLRRRDYDVGGDFAYRHDAAEDNTFQLVDTSTAARKTKRHTGLRNQQRPVRGGNTRNQRPDNRNFKGGRKPFNRRKERKTDLNASVEVGPDWEIIDEFELSQLLKLQTASPAVEDLLWAGVASKYNEVYDKVTVKTSKTLQPCLDKVFHNVTSNEDSVLMNFFAENKGNVFVTDSVLSHLMASPRSVYSWDIVVQKVGDVIFFDKRRDSTIDLLTVNETALDNNSAPEEVEPFNQPDQLAEEATVINQNFTQQVLLSQEENRKVFEANPFVGEDDEGEPASVAYRYRSFTLGDVKLVVRCEINSFAIRNGEEKYMNLYALNEWDPRYTGNVNWRQKLDLQRSSVLATELKNNSAKVTKWVSQALLAGADQMKIGYVSRVLSTDPSQHALLGTQLFKPADLAHQINLSIPNVWGIVKFFSNMFLDKEEGKYVIFKDPAKQVIKVYSVPPETFEEVEEEEDYDDEEEDVEDADARE